jgi:hypothetical protein
LFVVSAAVAQVPQQGCGAYYNWVSSCIDGISKDIPAMTPTVDAAAKRYVEAEGSVIGAMGDEGFTGEVSGRSGGIMWMRGGPGRPESSIVLYAIREDRLDKAVKDITDMHDKGVIVVVFARKQVLDQAQKAGAKWTSAVDNHAAPNGGLFKNADGKWVVPTDTTANAIASWTWVGEFVAGCARLGKFPVIYEGYAVPGAMDWDKEVGKNKFHPEEPFKPEPGRYGRDFLRNLKKDIDAVYFGESGDIKKVSALAVRNRKAGKGVYTFIHGHCAMAHVGYPGDPGYFTQCNEGWFAQKKDITLRPGDFVFCVGFDQIFEGGPFKTWTTDARKSGAVLAWSITDYKEDPSCGVVALAPGEILVSQRWGFGDAVVNVPMHPVNILPTSGVLAEYVFWSTNAEVHQMVTGKATAEQM